MKRCSKCKIKKTISEFCIQSCHSNGLDYLCKICRRKYSRKYYKKNRRIIISYTQKWQKNNRKKYLRGLKISDLKRDYGITLQQYKEMFKKQNGICAICKKKETHKNQFGITRLAVDHNHKTNKVRGLLCCNCNIGLGRFKENTRILKNVISYLKGGLK